MKKHGAFYTCQRCGLSLRPWEIEKAQNRAKDEVETLKESDPHEEGERKKRQLKKYRNWYEGKNPED